jgi:uncharacterized membrane protein YedE/YeeE
MEDIPVTTIVGSAGFLAGIVFGMAAQKSSFCTMGALSDIAYMGNFTRFRAWILAIAVAMVGTQTLQGLGVVDIYKSIYMTANLGWLGAITGGLLFGFGMTMSGGCAGKNVMKIGTGNLKAIIVIMTMGIFAYMTLRGLTGLARVQMQSATNIDLTAFDLRSQGMIDMFASLIGTKADSIRGVFTAVVVGGLLFYCFKDAEFRSSKRLIVGGTIIGLMVPIGWLITGILGSGEFESVPLFTFSFVAPTGNSIQYLMTFTGATISFGVAMLGGVIVGAFIIAFTGKTFHLEGFTDIGDMSRHLIGAALMGVGGVTALGCTIGQGVSGISTLAFGSLLALLSIILGGFIGLKYLETGSLGGAVRALVSRG